MKQPPSLLQFVRCSSDGGNPAKRIRKVDAGNSSGLVHRNVQFSVIVGSITFLLQTKTRTLSVVLSRLDIRDHIEIEGDYQRLVCLFGCVTAANYAAARKKRLPVSMEPGAFPRDHVKRFCGWRTREANSHRQRHHRL